MWHQAAILLIYLQLCSSTKEISQLSTRESRTMNCACGTIGCYCTVCIIQRIFGKYLQMEIDLCNKNYMEWFTCHWKPMRVKTALMPATCFKQVGTIHVYTGVKCTLYQHCQHLGTQENICSHFKSIMLFHSWWMKYFSCSRSGGPFVILSIMAPQTFSIGDKLELEKVHFITWVFFYCGTLQFSCDIIWSTVPKPVYMV